MKSSSRITIVVAIFFSIAFAIIARLFYWQILKGPSLAALASSQRERISELIPNRGAILASDGFPLAINQEGFLVYANPQEIKETPKAISQLLAPFLAPGIDEVKIATDASQKEIEDKKEELISDMEDFINSQLEKKELIWVLLKPKIKGETKAQIDELNLKGIYFEKRPYRAYPEASMAAHLIGFVGQDEYGKDYGYFGLEGFYELDLTGRIGIIKQEKDAINRPIPIGKFWQQEKKNGRNLELYLDRGIQFLVEQELGKAVEKYEAKRGSVIIMDPKTGGILAMATYPSFNPEKYVKYDYENFTNSLVSQSYEPGSTFKVITVAAGIEEKKITPETKCDICDKPLKVDKYTIRTWNDKYYKNTNMIEALQHSDNVAMCFIASKLGLEVFPKYIKNFGIGSLTQIDLEGEIAPQLRANWSQTDLYTASFGQGLVVTPIQMITAVSAIANKGNLIEPRIVKKITDAKKEVEIQPKIIRKVISEDTAQTVTDMMVSAVRYGEAQWAVPKGYSIAGKTGTAQISVGGEYDTKKTIASFVGFAPADNPFFVMLTIIEEPKTSQWGSETAAPLFFSIAKKLFVHMGIPKEI